jgi:hypothetical protein
MFNSKKNGEAIMVNPLQISGSYQKHLYYNREIFYYIMLSSKVGYKNFLLYDYNYMERI